MTPSLESFEISNYKSIEKSGEIRVPGISLILGPNGSGKTNILESLLLLKQTFENNQSNLKLNGNIIKTGEYKNIIHRKDVNKDLSYRFNFSRELENQNPKLICPVCQKEYTYEGYFTNHMEDKHEQFWREYSSDYSKFTAQYAKDPYVELRYTYDKQSRSNRLDSIKFGNPYPEDGLYLSSVSFINEQDGRRVKAEDIQGQEIINLSSSQRGEDQLRELNPNNIRRQIINTLYAHLPRDEEEAPYWFYRTPDPDVENTDFIDIQENTEKIQDFLNHREEIQEQQGEDRVRQLADGLILRLLSSSDSHGAKLSKIQSFLSNINHVGPLRNSPRRIYFGAGGSPGLQAENDNQVEKRIFSSEQSRSRELIQQTNKWLSETGFDCQLDVSEVGVGDLYQLEVKQAGLSINLADAGFGLSQTIPIIIECISMQISDEPPSRTVRHPRPPVYQDHDLPPLGIIEQPEIHLNPRIEASLGDFFIDVIESGSRLMIETHSEHLLNRLQRRVVDGSIEDEDSVVIYFVSKEEDESEIREIEISSSGEFSDWPEGFFQDDFEDAMEILKESI